METKVWIVNSSKHDYSAASKYGIITPVFQGNVYIFDAHAVVEDAVRMLDEHAGPDDYLLLAGYTFLNLIVGHYFLQKFGKVKALIFSQRKEEYRPVTLYNFQPKALENSTIA
jgi:hypothetical protein